MSEEAMVWVSVSTRAIADVVAEIRGYSDACPGILWEMSRLGRQESNAGGCVLMSGFDIIPGEGPGNRLEMMLRAGQPGRWGDPGRVVAEVRSDAAGWRWQMQECPAALVAPDPQLGLTDAPPVLEKVVADLADRIIDGITKLVNQQLHPLSCHCRVKHVELRDLAVRLGVAIRAGGGPT